MRRKLTKHDECDFFRAFWDDVWRPNARHTDSRGLARDAFYSMVAAGADPKDIVDGARCFIRTMKTEDKKFVPLSATFLHRQGWEDLDEQEREYQARLSQAKERPANVVEMKPKLPANHFLNRYKQGA